MIRRSKLRGAVAAEFVIVFPMFLAVIMIILEFSVMWKERHVLKLASFEASRSLMAEDSPAPCAVGSSAADLQAYEKRLKRAEAAAELKTAVIAPRFTGFLQDASLPIPTSMKIKRSDGSAINLTGDLVKYGDKLISAKVLTSIECEQLNGAIKVTTKFYRNGTFPFSRSIFWAIYSTNKMLQSLYTNTTIRPEHVRAQLGGDFFGIEVKSDSLANASLMLNDLKAKATDVFNTLKNSGVDPSVVSSIEAATVSSVNSASSAISSVNGELDKVGALLTRIVYLVPEQFRLIPVTSSVVRAMPKEEQGDWDGKVFLVAPVHTSESGQKHWREWSRNLVEKGNF